MGERTDQIERHIQMQRDELEDNFSELERKVRDAFDWRAQFQEHPGTLLGLALVGGALVGAILPGRSSVTSRVTSRRRSFSEPRSYEVPEAAPAPPSWNAYSPSSQEPPQKTSEVWNNLKNAAIGLVTARLSEVIEGVVPGFAEHYKKAATENKTKRREGVRPYSVPAPASSASTTDESAPKLNGGTDYGSHS